MRMLVIIVISAVMSLFGLVMYQKFLLPKQIKKIYVVDTDKLINMQKSKIINAYKTNNNTILRQVSVESNKQMQVIKYIAKKDNAIVLAKKAVLSGYDKDITNQIILMAK